jgi:hypothetical protein
VEQDYIEQIDPASEPAPFFPYGQTQEQAERYEAAKALQEPKARSTKEKKEANFFSLSLLPLRDWMLLSATRNLSRLPPEPHKLVHAPLQRSS